MTTVERHAFNSRYLVLKEYSEMKKLLQIMVAVVLLGSLTIGYSQGVPVSHTFQCTPATTYINGLPYAADDVITDILHCGSTINGPYPDQTPFVCEADTVVDVSFVVRNIPGTYFCRAVHHSAKYNNDSRLSDAEANFTVTEDDLGFVSNPPGLLQ